jgi:hypothetical protein
VLRGKGLVVLVLGLGLFGCGSDAGSTAGPVNTAYGAVATTQPRWTPAQQEVVDAYLAAVDAELQAGEAADPESPQLVASHTGHALEQLQATYGNDRAAGRRSKLPSDTRFHVDVLAVERMDGDSALVTSCIVDDTVVFVASSGSVVNDTLAAVLLDTTLVREDGRWKVSDRQTQSTREGSTQCADS